MRVATVNAGLTVGFPRAEIQRGSFGSNPGKTVVRRQFKNPRRAGAEPVLKL
jgi:hypothetical protein